MLSFFLFFFFFFLVLLLLLFLGWVSLERSRDSLISFRTDLSPLLRLWVARVRGGCYRVNDRTPTETSAEKIMFRAAWFMLPPCKRLFSEGILGFKPQDETNGVCHDAMRSIPLFYDCSWHVATARRAPVLQVLRAGRPNQPHHTKPPVIGQEILGVHALVLIQHIVALNPQKKNKGYKKQRRVQQKSTPLTYLLE